MIVGIDLGTTHSLAALWVDGAPTLIPNVHGSVLTPSVVGIDDAGTLLVGDSARARLHTHPRLTVAGFKRAMGTGTALRIGAQQFRAEELSAFVLRSLKSDVEGALGREVREAVISVPAYFNDVQRKATLHAARLAGLHVERLVNEPTAAALAHGLEAREERLLVFDLGGGTFDVSIVERFEGVIEVRASAGDNYLGGEDFTLQLAQLLAERACLSLAPDDGPTSNAAWLHAAAERAKRELSRAASTTAVLQMGGDARHAVKVTREDLERVCAPLLERLREPIKKALRDARIRAQDLDRVVLVGGATRMPMIQRLVTTLLGRFPERSLDPDHAVALGVAIQAGLKERNQSLREVVLTDVAPYTLGIRVTRPSADRKTQRAVFAPIIERNTVVPVSREERFQTVEDGQTQIRVAVYQGESLLVEDNVFLDSIDIEVPQAPAGQQSVDVRFSYDVNGLLVVDVRSVSTGASRSAVIKGNASNLDEAELARCLERLAALKVHPRDDERNVALIHRAKRLYAASLGAERDAAGHALERFLAELDSQEQDRAQRARAELSRFLEAHDVWSREL